MGLAARYNCLRRVRCYSGAASVRTPPVYPPAKQQSTGAVKSFASFFLKKEETKSGYYGVLTSWSWISGVLYREKEVHRNQLSVRARRTTSTQESFYIMRAKRHVVFEHFFSWKFPIPEIVAFTWMPHFKRQLDFSLCAKYFCVCAYRFPS